MTAAVQDVVRGVLGLTEPLPADERFQDRGLDSMMALQLRNRLSEVTGAQLASTLAFEHPTPGPSSTTCSPTSSPDCPPPVRRSNAPSAATPIRRPRASAACGSWSGCTRTPRSTTPSSGSRRTAPCARRRTAVPCGR
ncbi:acyl carrier protein [Actinomadura keratinilytica]